MSLIAVLAMACCCARDGGAAQDESSAPSTDEFQEIMTLAGWGPDALAKFSDDRPLGGEETWSLLRLLRRLQTFDAVSLGRWTNADIRPAALVNNWDKHRGQLLRLEGRVQHVEHHALSPDDANRLELPGYFICVVVLGNDDASASVVTATIPDAWRETRDLDEPVSFTGLLVKRSAPGGSMPRYVFVARRIAWLPTTATAPGSSFGRSVLGGLGYDVGLLDSVRNRRRIGTDEREAFYQLLAAMAHIGPHQLIRFAQGNLADVAENWRAEHDAPAPRGLMARDVARQAEDGRYSVAPLFNDADNQTGNLVVLDGVARRAVRIDVGKTPGGKPSDVLRRFDLDHYFEVEMFTGDSQNNPLVFCVRRLPENFPTGPKIHEPVQVAGFFFKSWLYRSRQDGAHGEAVDSQQRLAPLLISPGLVWMQAEPAPAMSMAGIVAAGIFLLALAGIWLAAWWSSRGDRAFYRRAIARQYQVPEGESLDELAARQ